MFSVQASAVVRTRGDSARRYPDIRCLRLNNEDRVPAQEPEQCKAQVLPGPGQVNSIEASDPIIYPSGVAGQPWILHIVLDTAGSCNTVLRALRGSGIIKGTVIPTATSSRTFLVAGGCAGHYGVRGGGIQGRAHLLKYEPQHRGHMGCFAAGYSSFICGSSGGTISHVVLRASANETSVVISRSYSSDCEGVSRSTRPVRCGPRSCTHEHSQTTRVALQAEHIRLSGLALSLGANTPHLEVTQAPCMLCGDALAREAQSAPALSRRRSSQAHGADSGEKYWRQRFRLISRFVPSLPLTQQAWYSITPEEIAKHMMRRIAHLSRGLGRKIRVLDPMCGSGASAAICALMSEVEHVYANDIVGAEVVCAKEMATLYGVRPKVSFRVGSLFDLDPSKFAEQIDAVILCPPWGGPDYMTGIYDIDRMEPGYERMVEHLAKISRNIAVLMPKNLAIDQLARAAPAASSVEGVEMELNFLAGRVKTATVYYGGLVNNAIPESAP